MGNLKTNTQVAGHADQQRFELAVKAVKKEIEKSCINGTVMVIKHLHKVKKSSRFACYDGRLDR